jgi:glycine/D-amino acid oxidase-like deaminating enzyme
MELDLPARIERGEGFYRVRVGEFNNIDQAGILEQRLKNMFKEIKDIEIEYKYCGCFASTADNLGFIGPDPKHKNLWYCLGYGANGILFAILGGMMLSKMYLGEVDKDMRLFKVDRFDK